MQRADTSYFESLPLCASFADAFDAGNYRDAPDDWIVVATDVVGSTRAIDSGRYKDVTVAGAIGLTAVANLVGSLRFPFFFGGDGMVFLLPGTLKERVLDVLADTRNTVRAVAGLELRAGVVDVVDLRRMGHELCVGRVRISDRYHQAVARGTALTVVDDMLKGRLYGPIRMAPDSGGQRADFRGFTCRWQDIPSERGRTMSLIIAEGPDAKPDALGEAQRRLIRLLDDEALAHPLTVSAQVARAAASDSEARYRSRGRGLRLMLHRIRIAIEVAAVRCLIWSGVPLRVQGKTLARVREDNVLNSDVRKMDGTLKMVLSLTGDEHDRIIAELADLRRTRGIVYGYHVSDRALMTCLIHVNHEDEVHFVDAADGGYALAARMMKQQLGLM